MIVARAGRSFTQCLAVMEDPLRAVDFVARGEEGSESECLSLLDDLMREWTDVVEKHSPGTEYKMAYLSRKHLTEHKDQPAAYSEEAVEKAKTKGPSAFVAYDYEHAETLTDLLVCSPAEKCPATVPEAVTCDYCLNRALQHQVSDIWHLFVGNDTLSACENHNRLLHS